MSKKILVIEDDQSLRKALSEKIVAEGYVFLEAKDGEAGLELALQHKPDLILLDIIMPKMDGITMLKKLREDEWGKSAPIIVLTNLDSVSNLAEVLNEDVHDYLIKADWSLEDIAKKIKAKLAE